jgi:hypothetical protein
MGRSAHPARHDGAAGEAAGAHRRRRGAARLEGRVRRAGRDEEAQDRRAPGGVPDAAGAGCVGRHGFARRLGQAGGGAGDCGARRPRPGRRRRPRRRGCGHCRAGAGHRAGRRRPAVRGPGGHPQGQHLPAPRDPGRAGRLARGRRHGGAHGPRIPPRPARSSTSCAMSPTCWRPSASSSRPAMSSLPDRWCHRCSWSRTRRAWPTLSTRSAGFRWRSRADGVRWCGSMDRVESRAGRGPDKKGEVHQCD